MSAEPQPGKCGAENRQAKTPEKRYCDNPAGKGTDHLGTGRCKYHLGATRNHKKAAKREVAKKAVGQYGLSREIDPMTALMEELHRTAGHVAWLQELIGSGEVELDQNSFVSGDTPSVWIALYQEERKHFASVAKTCLAVGIEGKRIELAEQQGALMAQAIRGILVDLGVADRPEVPNVVRRHLTLVAGSD